MKKILVLVIAVLLALGLAACGPRNLEDYIEQEARQQGDDVDVEISGDSMTISGEEGQLDIDMGDGIAWPADKLPANVPQISGVTVTAVIDVGTGVMVSFEGCSQAAADAYIAQLESLGWEDSAEFESGDEHVVTLTTSTESLMFSWARDDGMGSVTYSQNS